MDKLQRRDRQWRESVSPSGSGGLLEGGSFTTEEGDIGWTFQVDGVFSSPDSSEVPEIEGDGDLQAEAVISGVSYSKGEIVVTPVEAGVGETYRVPYDFTDGSGSRFTKMLPFGSNQTEYSITAVMTEPNQEQTQVRYTTTGGSAFEVSNVSASSGEGTITVDYTIVGEPGQSFDGDIFINGPSIPSERVSGTLGSDGTYSGSESFEVLAGDYEVEIYVDTGEVGVFDSATDTVVVEGGGSLEVQSFSVDVSGSTLTANYTLGGVDDEEFYGSVKFDGPESEYIDISGFTGPSGSASGSESFDGPDGQYLVSMTLGSHDISLPSEWVDVSTPDDSGGSDGGTGGTGDSGGDGDSTGDGGDTGDGDDTGGSGGGDGTDGSDGSGTPPEGESFSARFERITGRKPTDPVVIAAGGAIAFLLATR